MVSLKVSVLMSVYNGDRYLREAIDSILNQTLENFEFIIIDDGSTDASNQIIKSYRDPRLKMVKNEENIGLTKSLNIGIGLCCGEYIARMDADDISLPEKLEKQIEFMDNNPEIGIMGTKAAEINYRGEIILNKTAHNTSDKAIKVQLMFGTCFLHPSVMIRRRMLERTGLCYDENFSTSQDYFLWWQLSSHTKFFNLSDVLLHCRKHSNRLSNYAIDDQNSNASRVRRLVVEALLERRLINKEFLFHNMLMTKPRSEKLDQLNKAEKWLIHLVNENEKRYFFDRTKFRIAMGKTWLSLCQNSTQLGYRLLKNYSNSNLYSYYHPSVDSYFKLVSKAMLKYNNIKYQHDTA